MRPSRQRSVYVTVMQKKKLIELIAKHPELLSRNVKQGFNYADCQRIWLSIASECNSIAGAKKTWRQWRKTWQDMRANVKKRRITIGEAPLIAPLLTTEEQEALGIKSVTSTTCQDTSQEFETLDLDNNTEHFENELESLQYSPEPESPPEHKVFIRTEPEEKIKTNKHKCIFNCDSLAAQEEKKVKMKEDYLNFKKEYLKQKLVIMKEQAEALKSIARELAK